MISILDLHLNIVMIIIKTNRGFLCYSVHSTSQNSHFVEGKIKIKTYPNNLGELPGKKPSCELGSMTPKLEVLTTTHP